MSSVAALDSQGQVLPYPTRPWPSHILDKVNKSNDEKGLGAPIAVILTAELDCNDSLTDLPHQFFLLKLAKTHFVVCRTIRQASDIPQEIAALPKDRIELLVFNAHGSDESMGFSEHSTYDEIDPNDFLELPKNASIVLLACRTANVLAKKMANGLPQTIYAPKLKLDLLQTTLSRPGQQLQLKAFRYGVQHISRFRQNQPPVVCDDIQPEDNAYFLEMQEFLFHEFQNGNEAAANFIGHLYDLTEDRKKAKKWFRLGCFLDADAQANLGHYYWENIKNLESRSKPFTSELLQKIQRNKDKAKFWFEKAAAHNSPRSYYYLGHLALQHGDETAAISYFHQASDLGVDEALISLGDLYLQKINTLQSIPTPSSNDLEQIHLLKKQAMHFFRKAAHHKNPDGCYSLARQYEVDGDFPMAIKWYREAIELGLDEAKEALRRVENQSTQSA